MNDTGLKSTSSLHQAWGEDKQDQWLVWKNSTIHDAVAELKSSTPLKDVYWHIAKARRQIAKELNHKDWELFGQPQGPNDEFLTFIGCFNKYRDFYPYLSHRFHSIPDSDKQNVPFRYIGFSYSNQYPGYIIKKVKKNNKLVEVIYNNTTLNKKIKCSELAFVRAVNENSKEFTYLWIKHTQMLSHEDMWKEITELESKLKQTAN